MNTFIWGCRLFGSLDHLCSCSDSAITVFSFKSVILAVDHVLDAQNSKIAPEEAFRLFRFAGSAVLKLSFLLTLCSCIHVFTVFDRPEFLGPPLATFYLSLLTDFSLGC